MDKEIQTQLKYEAALEEELRDQLHNVINDFLERHPITITDITIFTTSFVKPGRHITSVSAHINKGKNTLPQSSFDLLGRDYKCRRKKRANA